MGGVGRNPSGFLFCQASLPQLKSQSTLHCTGVMWVPNQFMKHKPLLVHQGSPGGKAKSTEPILNFSRKILQASLLQPNRASPQSPLSFPQSGSADSRQGCLCLRMNDKVYSKRGALGQVSLQRGLPHSPPPLLLAESANI